LLGTNYHSSFTTVKRSNAFWQGRGYSLEEHETYSASSFAGDVEVKAKQELLVQQVKEKTLEFLDRVRVLDGQLTFEFLEEFHKSESDYKDGPTAALAAVVVIAVTIATAGSGGPAADAGLKAATLAGQVTAAGTLTAAGTVISSMTAAAFTSLCTQSAIALLSAKGDIGQALKTICTPNTLKSIAFSAVTAGVTSGVGTYLGAASDPIGKIGVAIAKNTAGAAVRSILTGEDLGTGILRGVATAGIDVLAEEAAGAIGLKRSVDGLEAASTIPDFVAYTLHGAVGAGVGALTAIATGEKDIEGYALSGGLGAVVAEVAADLMTKDLRNIDTIVHENPGMTGAQLKEKLRAITEDKRKIAQFLGAAAGGFTGGHAYMADHMAENATTHNFIPMVMIGIELASLCVDMAVEYRKAEKVKEGSGREALTEYLGGAGFGAVAMKLVSRFASPAALKLLGGVLNASEIIDSGAGLVDAVQKAYRGESVDWLATTQAFLNAVLATRTFKGKAAHVKASHETVHVPEMSFGKGIHKQGMPFENYVATKMPKGARLPKNFKTFDFYDQNTGIATSVKTLDTKTPARLARPEGIFSTLKRGIDKTVEFDGARLSNMNLKSDMISDRHVLVGVPETTGADQWTQLQRAVEYGAARGVQVKIFKVVQ
jgi:filamentous hemagglutinin